MSRHDTDVVGFFFGVCFLVCAGLAIGVRTGNLGFASDGPDGAWIAGALLAVVGLIGVVGTLSGLRRRGATGERATVAPGSAGRDLDADETQVLDPPDPVEE